MKYALWCVLPIALACQGDPGELPLGEVDVTGYIAEVHDYVAVGCGTLDCHGDPGRPLRIYSEVGLRATPQRDDVLTMDELEESAMSFIGVDDAPVAQNLSLLKPLAESAGGLHHVGGEVWADTNAAGYRCLRAWLEGTVMDATDACAEARASVSLPPE